jgi:hypothetical protein
MKLSDRIKRWWAPAQWRDDHPETSDGEGFAESEEQERAEGIQHPGLLEPPGLDQPGDYAEPH